MIAKFLLTTVLLTIFTSILYADNAQHGLELHSENCITCHAAMTGGDGSVLYTRKNRNVISMSTLADRVNYCQSSLKLNWSEKQQQAVKEFLNKSYYNF